MQQSNFLFVKSFEFDLGAEINNFLWWVVKEIIWFIYFQIMNILCKIWSECWCCNLWTFAE